MVNQLPDVGISTCRHACVHTLPELGVAPPRSNHMAILMIEANCSVPSAAGSGLSYWDGWKVTWLYRIQPSHVHSSAFAKSFKWIWKRTISSIRTTHPVTLAMQWKYCHSPLCTSSMRKHMLCKHSDIAMIYHPGGNEIPVWLWRRWRDNSPCAHSDRSEPLVVFQPPLNSVNIYFKWL